MLRTHLLAVSLAAMFGIAASTAAQDFIGSAGLGAECRESQVEVTFGVRVLGYGSGHPELVGFDLYRREADPCGAAIRLTDSPWPRELSSDFTHRLTDAAIVPGRMYEYRVIGVDAGREALSGFDAWYDFGSFFTTWAGCGSDAVAHGGVRREGGFAYVETCPDACLVPHFTPLESWPAEMEVYFGTGTPLILHADLLCGTVEGCWLRVRSFEVTPCTVSVESTHWSQMKSLFR